MAAPSVTENSAANADASASLAASASRTFDVDFRSKFGGEIQIKLTGGGTVAGTNGLKVEWFLNNGTASQVDTKARGSFIIPAVVSQTDYQSFALPTGRWRVKLTNLDASNAVTASATTTTIDSIA